MLGVRPRSCRRTKRSVNEPRSSGEPSYFRHDFDGTVSAIGQKRTSLVAPAADSVDAELASRLLRLREDTLRFVGRLMPKPRAPDEAEAPGQITDQSQSKAVH
jgi:hypothetical protein